MNRGNRGVAPVIRNHGARRRWVVNFQLRPIYPFRNYFDAHWIGS